MGSEDESSIAAPSIDTASATLEPQRDARGQSPTLPSPPTTKELSCLDRCEVLGWDEV